MSKKKRKQRPSSERGVAVREKSPPPVEPPAPIEAATFHAAAIILTAMLLAVIWWNRFLPMQDFPQHLFMAVVANTYDDPTLDWQEHFELRNQFGPYRGTHLALRGLCYFTSPETSGKVLASAYVLLVLLAVTQVARQTGGGLPAWGAIVAFPLSIHPMYFYGFINYVISIPVLLLALLDLKPLAAEPFHWKSVCRQLALQVALFFLHPYTLLVFVVLAFSSVWLVGSDRQQRQRLLVAAGCAVVLFLGAIAYEEAVAPGRQVASRFDPHQAWWPWDWTWYFLSLQFVGFQVIRDPNWLIAGLWAALAFVVLWAAWRRRGTYRLTRWFPAMFGLALAGYLVLPFTVYSDGPYTFFNVRMAPVVFFLLVPIIAAIPLGRLAGPVFAAICLCLTGHGAYVHHRVAAEIERDVQIVELMEKNAAVLPLIGKSYSDYLDPFYYNNFHQCFPFYYHILKGGGVNPDMFDRRLMPVGFREGKKPQRPPHWEPHKWADYGGAYDYILAQRLQDPTRQLLGRYCDLLGFAGPWTLYRVRK